MLAHDGRISAANRTTNPLYPSLPQEKGRDHATAAVPSEVDRPQVEPEQEGIQVTREDRTDDRYDGLRREMGMLRETVDMLVSERDAENPLENGAATTT